MFGGCGMDDTARQVIEPQPFKPEELLGTFYRGVLAVREEALRCARVNAALDPEWVALHCRLLLEAANQAVAP